MLNGKICYIENSSDRDMREGINALSRVYNVIDMDTDEKYLTIIDYNDSTYFKDGILNLKIEIDHKDSIFNMGSYIAFISYSSSREIVYMDINTGEVVIIDNINNEIGYNYIGNNKLSTDNIIFDYFTKKEIMIETSIINSFKYRDNDYYIVVNIENNTFNIYIHVDHIETVEFNVKIYPECIIIGTEDDNMKVSTKLLYDNSKHVQNLLGMSNNQSFKFINSFYCNIGVYVDYIQNGVLKNDSLGALYKISSLLDDFNMESLTYSIIKHIKRKDVNITHAWDFLKVLYVDDTYCVFNTVLYIIYKKYNRDEFMSMLKFTTQMSDDIISELIMERRVT